MKIFILAAGKEKKFSDGTIKQLVKIGNELLLCRTIRQLAEHGYTPWVVTQSKKIIKAVGNQAQIWLPLHSRWTAETFLDTRSEWHEHTVVLLGDVFFTDKTLHRIVEYTEALAVFGKPTEIFAWAWSSENNERVQQALTKAITQVQHGHGRGKLGDAYRALVNLPAQCQYGTDSENIFVSIKDLTIDVDTEKRYAQLLKKLKL